MMETAIKRRMCEDLMVVSITAPPSMRCRGKLSNRRNMALADIPTTEQSRRLDSWKEIAEYIGRDVRTATRWESQGLPLHRVPGGRGTSVFAFTNEIDAWMAGKRPAPDTQRAPAVEDPPPSPPQRSPLRIIVPVTAALSLVAIGLFARTELAPEAVASLRVSLTTSDVSVTGDSGVPRVIHRFQPGTAVLIATATASVVNLDDDGIADLIVPVAFYQDPRDHSVSNGELLNLSAAGGVQWRFSFDDVLTFGNGTVSGPWALADWRASSADPRARIAVAAHDYTWWGSMVAVLDHQARRQSTFVNPGWIESVLWLGPNRLALAGFSNARNEAVLAVVDGAADAQAPGTGGTPFACTSCASTLPLFYGTFPRSELNRVTGGRFNRARVGLVGDRILVTTTEIQESTVTAIYEFDRELRLTRARYSEAYWDAHRRLEGEGRLTHTREACAESQGPPAIHVWAANGWQPVTPLR